LLSAAGRDTLLESSPKAGPVPDLVRRLSFDLKRCPACAGKGKDGRDQTCKRCHGTGDLQPEPAPPPPATLTEDK